MAETIKKPKAPAKPKTTAAKTERTTEKVAAPVKTKSAATRSVEAKSTNGKPAAQAPTPQQIAELAHKYWHERGGHHGSHEHDWLRAEQELRGKAS